MTNSYSAPYTPKRKIKNHNHHLSSLRNEAQFQIVALYLEYR